MKTLTTDTLVEDIQRTAREARGQFPTHDCEALARQAGIDPQSLISDLDTYFYDVWSPANGVKKLPRKSDAWLSELKAFLEQDFVSRYAQYAVLEARITREAAPDLYQRLRLFETLRKKLLLFVSELLTQAEAGKKPRETAGV